MNISQTVGTSFFPGVEPPAFALDGRKRVVYWNASAERLLGVKGSAVLGCALDRVLSQEIVDAITSARVLEIPGVSPRSDRTVYLLRSETYERSCPLTEREKGILALVANGWAALNIAARLGLSHATIRNHIQNILRKLEVHSQVEAVAIAFRRGWIDGLEAEFAPLAASA